MQQKKIRLACKTDLPDILQLSRDLFLDPSSSSDKYANPEWPVGEAGQKAFKGALSDGFLWVAENDGNIVGFICAEESPTVDWRPIKRVELLSFYVKPDYRSYGLGKELIDELFSWAKDKEAKTVFVSAYADNLRGVEFYKRMGFEEESLLLEKEL